MFIVCSSAEICSIVFGIKYCLIDTDPGLKYAEFGRGVGSFNCLSNRIVDKIDIVDIVDRYLLPIVDKLIFDCQLLINFVNFNS